MKRNVKKIIFMVLGLIITITGFVLLYINVLSIDDLSVYTGEYDKTSNYQLIREKLSYKDNAIDLELNVTAPSSILIREVEMVQYYKDDGGVRLVLANYPIKSFEDDGVNYTNPSFNINLSSKIFYSDTYVDDLKLDEKAIETIVNDESFIKTQLTGLVDVNNDYNLISNDNCFISGDDEWKLGDIKVTYYYLDLDNLEPISIIGKINNGVIDTTSEKALVTSNYLEFSNAREMIQGNELIYVGIIILGLLFMIIPYVFKNSFNK